MSNARIVRGGLLILIGLVVLWMGSCLVSCVSSGADVREIQFNLNDSLKNYSTVLITVVDAKDSTHVLDTAYSGRLTDPKTLPPYQIPDSIAGDFRIRIQAFNDKGELALQSNITVTGGVPGAPVKVPPEKLPALIATVTSAHLASLELSIGDLAPSFKADVFAYTLDLPFASDTLILNAMAADSQSSVYLGAALVQYGSPSKPQALVVGENVFTIKVKPKGSDLSNTYTLTVNRKPGNVFFLDSISLSAGHLTPAFSPDSVTYAVTVPTDTDSIVVTPYAKDPLAKIELNGSTFTSGMSTHLDVGATTTIPVKVTSEDGTGSTTYQINVERLPSSNPQLEALEITSGTLVPEFDSEINQYTVTVNQAQVSLIPYARAGGAKITVDGQPVNQGATSQPLNLDVGLTTVIVAVTAPDGKTKKSYSVTLNRASPDAYLSGMQINGVTFDSSFQADRFHYKAAVPRTTDKIVLTCLMVTKIKSSSASLNDVAVTDTVTTTTIGAFKSTAFTMNPKVGGNVIKVLVTAPDGITTNTYSIDLVRTPNTNTDLTTLSYSSGIMKPAFAPAVIFYEDTVSSDTKSVIVTAKAQDTAAMVIFRLKRQDTTPVKQVCCVILPPKWNLIRTDTLLVTKPSAAFAVEAGVNLVEIEVVAEDGVTRHTVTTSLFRRYSTNSLLGGLIVAPTGGTALVLTPAFDPKTGSYNASTTAGFVSVTPTAAEVGQVITVNGNVTLSGKVSTSITLQLGANIIQVVNTAQDQKTKSVYVLTVQKYLVPILK